MASNLKIMLPLFLMLQLGSTDLLPGEELFQGDVRLTPEQWADFYERKVTRWTSQRWTNKNVPYYLGAYQNSNSNGLTQIKAGIKDWQDKTCLTFTEVQESTSSSPNHLKFIKGSGCWSYVGMVGFRQQEISIGSGCELIGTTTHEIGHAIGFHHEQNRPDRNEWITIMNDSIQTNRLDQFDMETGSLTFDIPYDYTSMMQYATWGFSIGGGAKTMKAKDPLGQPIIDKDWDTPLSHMDMAMADKAYGCTEQYATQCGVATDYCKNLGVLRPATGGGCTCACPDGTDGDTCQNVNIPYLVATYIARKPADTLTAPTNVQVTGSGSHVAQVKSFTAPHCKLVSVSFTAFNLDNGPSCRAAYVQLISGPGTHDKYCDTQLAGQTKVSATKNLLMVVASNNMESGHSVSADVTYVDDPACSGETTTANPATEQTTTDNPATEQTTTDNPTTEQTTTENPSFTTTMEPSVDNMTFIDSGDSISLRSYTSSCDDDANVEITGSGYGPYSVTIENWQPGCNVYFYTMEPRKMQLKMNRLRGGGAIDVVSMMGGKQRLNKRSTFDIFSAEVKMQLSKSFYQTFIHGLSGKSTTMEAEITLESHPQYKVVSITGTPSRTFTIQGSSGRTVEPLLYWIKTDSSDTMVDVTVGPGDLSASKRCWHGGAVTVSNVWDDHVMEDGEGTCAKNLPATVTGSKPGLFIFSRYKSMRNAQITITAYTSA